RSPSLAVNEEEVVAFGKTRWCIALVACLLAASTGIYYAAFGCFLLVIAGLYCLGHQYWRGCAIAVALTAILFLGVGTNLLPSALYRFAHGANREAVVRNPQAAEIYGMKVTQLVLPMSVHRLPWIGRKKLLYNTAMPWGSSDYGYLGAIGVAGFLILVGRFLVKRSRAAENRLLDVVQTLNLFAVLFATVGGFGMVASLYLGAWLRCFERMSIVIGFLSLLAVGLVLDRSPWLRQSHRRRAVVLGILLAVGILEQTSVHFVPPYNALAREYAHDAAFIARIESEMPAGATIFQLPYMSFPENGPLCRIGDYEPVRGYLHSYSLRWSYGAVKGRKADAWQRTVAGLPVADMVQNLTTAGFQGIYIDRRGYEDKGASLERDLTELRGRTPLTSPNGRLSFFDIRPYEPPETETANCPWQARVH
ncbi:MAG TPA: hypothetical protein VGY58_17145, partial [Gemmataceae bacterium]|nr:hypothetical protein [Gemmataceae bacterium]